ncbi:MAG TPA: carbon-nitrogen hydrolase family protein [Acetobacteraceae bacterium]|nr:carbon-nitrogen hydrolase family protein [Acetobacteraceae bacterium]
MSLRIALAQFPITGPARLEQFWHKVDAILGDAASGGAALAVLPEYACMETAACFPGAGSPTAELAAVSAIAADLLQGFRDAARRHKIWLLPGTLPWQSGARVLNRAPLIAPDGRLAWQEKSIMTRFEAESWGVCSGGAPRVFTTEFGRIGIAICYDVEFPALVHAQAAAGAWLILAPSCTDSLHGFNRVRLSARARALENQCFVAVAPTVGNAPHLASVDENHGYAAVFGPVDRGFPDDGVIVRGALDEAGLVFADLDPHKLEAVRNDGAVRNFRDWPDNPPACADTVLEVA